MNRSVEKNGTFADVLFLASGIVAGILGSYLLAVDCYMLFMTIGTLSHNVIEFDDILPFHPIIAFVIGAALYVWAAMVLFKLFSYDAISYVRDPGSLSGKLADFRERRSEVKYKMKRLSMERDVYWLASYAQRVIRDVPEDYYALASAISKGLGMGIVEIDVSRYAFTRANLENTDFMRNWSEGISEDKAIVKSVTRIWESALHGLRVEYGSRICELGRDLGVDGMLRAYAAGVPVEYIVG